MEQPSFFSAAHSQVLQYSPCLISERKPGRRASVAVVIRQNRVDGKTTEILFLKRVDRPGDPWSGNVCLPGGHREEGESAREAAERETEEECGLKLSDSKVFTFLGSLDDRRVGFFSPKRQRILSTFVYALKTDFTAVPAITLQKSEMEAYRWVSVESLRTTRLNWCTAFDLAWKGNTSSKRSGLFDLNRMIFPSLLLPTRSCEEPSDNHDHVLSQASKRDQVEGDAPDECRPFVLWGLTFRVVSEFLFVVQSEEPAFKTLHSLPVFRFPRCTSHSPTIRLLCGPFFWASDCLFEGAEKVLKFVGDVRTGGDLIVSAQQLLFYSSLVSGLLCLIGLFLLIYLQT
uniref:Nudix hydrolase domain-containing protein n=1 Tax=Chromera velia CCMP2878 TaxID=1169474 RepID=A0A0G4HA69_9ALVE|eukprot:Cvel_25611.t1-p1 / transcript=Cvel_25611.t1 / gene=Cvel_25611 / organism=Chromera_velia_CCMP2878 / gene_product=hypothetical protein / transcript_product=hypothetical protein / location=Cvel_scaffold2924:17649-18677(+) / protein_length=343 / sequence_SO=supercontig / SO=protein_coding / is_pseudo=false